MILASDVQCGDGGVGIGIGVESDVRIVDCVSIEGDVDIGRTLARVVNVMSSKEVPIYT
jgi:hypothetical protein